MSLGTLGSFHGMCGAESEYSVAHLMFKQVVQRALAVHREVRGPVEGRRCIREGLGVQGCRVTLDAIAVFAVFNVGLFTTGLFGRHFPGPGLGIVSHVQLQVLFVADLVPL